jgi:PAS domain S-box-containing protein
LKKNNQIFQLLFESAAEGLVVVNRSGIIKLVNPQVSQLFGYEEDELIDQLVEILIPDVLKKSHVQHRSSYMKAPKSRSMGSNMNLLAQRKDGTDFYVEIGLNHFKVDDEIYVMALISDITDRATITSELERLNDELETRVKERTKALESSQKLYKLIASNFPNGTINVFDRDLRYVFAEGEELRKLGITGERLIGTKYIDRLHKSISKEIELKLNEVLKGKSLSFEIEHQKNFYVINAVPLRDSGGEVEQILVIEKNITDKKIAENQMQEMLEKEKHLNELKSRFVSMASHEFRTPLSTILSSTSLAERYSSEEQQEKRDKHFKRIKTSVHSLTTILNDFLSLDKLEQGIVDINLSAFNLKDLIDEVVEEITTGLNKGQRLELNFVYPQIDIISDRNVIRNVLNNLLTNASKYSAEGKLISLSVKEVKKGLQIEVQDQGIGIPEKEQKQLFERFFRAKNVTNIQGTGLGLNIVKKYVDLLGGEISFESSEENGTKFTVVLPNK